MIKRILNVILGFAGFIFIPYGFGYILLHSPLSFLIDAAVSKPVIWIQGFAYLLVSIGTIGLTTVLLIVIIKYIKGDYR